MKRRDDDCDEDRDTADLDCRWDPYSEEELRCAERSPPCILIVDDEESIRRAAGKALQRHGFRCYLAASGRQALELFQKRSMEISAILLDLSLPDIPGATVLRHIRQAGSEVPVLLCSGLDAARGNRTDPSDPRTGFIEKPYGTRELMDQLERLLLAR